MPASYKIPLLVLTTVATQIASSPPTPPTKPEDPSEHTSSSRSSRHQLTEPRHNLLIKGARLAGHAVVLVECLVLAALPPPQFGYSRSSHILDILTPSFSDASRVRLTPTFATGCSMVLCGAGLRLWCYRTLGRFFTFEMKVSEKQKLVTSGPYAVVRHPAYLGAFLMLAGFPLAYHGAGSWLRECVVTNPSARITLDVCSTLLTVTVGSFFWQRVTAEDALLREHFGLEWEEWAKKTWKLIPFLY